MLSDILGRDLAGETAPAAAPVDGAVPVDGAAPADGAATEAAPAEGAPTTEAAPVAETAPAEAAQLRSAGLPVLLGTQSGLAAFAHLRNWSHRAAKVAAWNDCLAQTPFDLSTGPINRPWTEAESMAALANEWLRPPHMISVGSAGEAVIAANAIGYPVVLKTAQPGITHKSDVSGVVLNLADATMVSEDRKSVV